MRPLQTITIQNSNGWTVTVQGLHNNSWTVIVQCQDNNSPRSRQ